MPRTRWIFLPFAFLVVVAWSRAQSTTPAPAQARASAISPAESAGSLQMTELPRCPAELGDGLETGVVGKDMSTKGVTPPRLKHSIEARIPDAVRREFEAKGIANFAGASILSLIVNTDGKPQILCLEKAAGYGLDLQAANAVSQFSFAPAIQDGKPVRARITIEVNFNWLAGRPYD